MSRRRMLFVTGYGGWVDLYPTAIGEAFKRLGYGVDFFASQSGVPIRRFRQRYDMFNMASPPLLGSRLNPLNRLINRCLLARVAATRPGLVLVGKGETLLPGTVSAMRRLGAVVANFSSDDAFGRHHPRNRLHNLEEYDLVFNFDAEGVRRLRAQGIPAWELPCSAAEIFKPDPGEPVLYPVTFIGQYQPKREVFLEALPPLGLRIWGPDWQRRCRNPVLRRLHRPAFSREHRLLALYRASRITVNIHDVQTFEATNFRTFEALACGTFLLCEENPGLPRLFEPGREIVTFRTPEELAHKTRYYLAHPEEARRIAEAGRRRVDAEHRIFHRMSVIARLAEGLMASRFPPCGSPGAGYNHSVVR